MIMKVKKLAYLISCILLLNACQNEISDYQSISELSVSQTRS